MGPRRLWARLIREVQIWELPALDTPDEALNAVRWLTEYEVVGDPELVPDSRECRYSLVDVSAEMALHAAQVGWTAENTPLVCDGVPEALLPAHREVIARLSRIDDFPGSFVQIRHQEDDVTSWWIVFGWAPPAQS